MVVHQSTVLPPTFSFIFFLHAGDKSHNEACLHLPQFLYFAALLSCFAMYIGGHVCMCVRVHSIQVLSQYIRIHLYVHTYVHTVYIYTVCTYVRMYVCNCTQFEVLPLLPPLAVSKVYSKTTYVHTYMHTLYTCVHTYIHTY